jgi:hypothetical protein
MKVREFESKCHAGTHVVRGNDRGRRGVVRKISIDKLHALVDWNDHTISWHDYYTLELVEPQPKSDSTSKK